MKFYSLLFSVFFFVFSNGTSAQEVMKHFCNTDEMQEKAYKEHPELLQVKQQLDEFTQQWIKDHPTNANRTADPANKPGAVSYVIPVVFHILHQYGQENISDAQIIDQMRIWNEDLQKRNADTTAIIDYFKPYAANCGMEFRLATIDPNGNCTNGIDRIATPLTYAADDASKLNFWPRNKYLNVWTCASLAKAGTAAYAYYPGTAPSNKDGIIAISTYIGSVGTGTYYTARVMGHETAHCFNLSHPWGSTNTPAVSSNCNTDDGVGDTPNTMGWDNCPANLNQGTCIGQGGHTAGVPDNIQNYMEYSYCGKMFTIGQRDQKMIPALNSTAGGLYYLWQPSNLIATGTADPYDYNLRPLCTPVADFSSNRQILCSGDSIRFTDFSSKGKPSSWQWSFSGGSPSSSTDSMPYVHYNTIGTYSVTLTTSNATGTSAPITKTSFVQVIDPVASTTPATQGFESASFPPSGAAVSNPDNLATWKRASTAGAASSSASMVMENYGIKGGRIDEYITPSYDFTNLAPSITYDRAYAYYTSDTTRLDALKIYYSTNCGQTWTLRSSKSGTSLITTTKQAANWVPNSTQWKNDSVSIFTVLKNKSNVRFKFQSVGAGGNSLYIDNINITAVSTVGIDDPDSPVSAFDVYPNPTKEQININVTFDRASDLRIELFDITGRKISDVANEKMASGMHNYSVNQHLQDGVYFVRLTSGSSITSKRVVVMD